MNTKSILKCERCGKVIAARFPIHDCKPSKRTYKGRPIVARIDINFDDSITILNDHTIARDAYVPNDLFLRHPDTVLQAERLLNEQNIPWREYRWNEQTQKRDLVRQSDNYPYQTATQKAA